MCGGIHCGEVERWSPFEGVYFILMLFLLSSGCSAGSLGTRGRECKPDSSGLDSCDVMCCGRGYQEERVVTTTDCNCRFIYCCYTECEKCTNVENKYYCN